MFKLIETQIDYVKGYVKVKYQINDKLFLIEFITNSDDCKFNIADLVKLDRFLKDNILCEIFVYCNSCINKVDVIYFVGHNSIDKEVVLCFNCKVFTYGLIR